jgi:hypothetical protein
VVELEAAAPLGADHVAQQRAGHGHGAEHRDQDAMISTKAKPRTTVVPARRARTRPAGSSRSSRGCSTRPVEPGLDRGPERLAGPDLLLHPFEDRMLASTAMPIERMKAATPARVSVTPIRRKTA